MDPKKMMEKNGIMENGKSARRSIWEVGNDFTDRMREFEEVAKRKEAPAPPKVIMEPKFPYSSLAQETTSGKPTTPSSGAPPGSKSAPEKKFLKLPGPTTMDFTQTLKKPNAYPQMEGPFEVVPATADELETVEKFLQTFAFWVLLARLFFKTNFYKKEWESKNKYDLVFMRLDPILIGSAYVHITEIGIPSISGCNMDNFNVEVKGERSKNPTAKVFNKVRRDTEYKITAELSCPSIDGRATFAVTNNNNQPDPKAEKGTFKFVFKELKVSLGMILTKIDENFETEEIRYRPPQISMNYNTKGVDVTVEKVPSSSPIPQQQLEQLLNDYKNKELIGKKDQIAQRMVDAYEKRLSPLIVQLRWIHQLHDVMYFTMVNEPDKTIPEFSKIQTRLVEVVFTALAHKKFRELIFEALQQESYEPFKKLVYFRESPELRTTRKVNTMIKNANSMGKDDIRQDISDVIEYEMSTKERKFKRIVDLQFYIMRFFTESILI